MKPRPSRPMGFVPGTFGVAALLALVCFALALTATASAYRYDATAAAVGSVEIGTRPGSAVHPLPTRGSIGGYPGELGGAIARGGSFNDPVTAFKQLEVRYGIESRVLSERFHRIKPAGGAGARDDTLIDLTGNVYDTTTGERLGQIIVRQGG